MCWRKKPQEPEVYNSKTLLHFAINNYPGTSNDLNGCVNDQTDLEAFFNKNYPEFAVEKYKDSEVTWQRLHDEIKNHIVAMKTGDILVIGYSGHGTYGPDGTETDGSREGLYPYDGRVFWDDDFRALLDLIPEGASVYIILDSCFAGGSTLTRNPAYMKNRFMPLEGYVAKKRPRAMLRSDKMNYLLFAGCSEGQTCADAYLNGRYNGAFTYYLIRNWGREKSNYEWLKATVYYISAGKFEQVPQLIGDDIMKTVKSLT